MNEVIRQLNARKSVRAYTDREIGKAEKEAILMAAAQAPTAGNQQLYTIIDVTDQAIKDTLVRTCDNQPFIADAKLVLIFCADCKKWYDAFRFAGCEPRLPGVGDLALAISDATIAAQNAVVAAESLGIGSCYIGDIMENCDTQREILGLPEYVKPVCMVVIGVPTQQQKERKKPARFDVADVVHENTYKPAGAEGFRAMLEKRQGISGEDMDRWLLAFTKRKWNCDFSREMSRSAAQMISEWCEGK